MYDVLPLFLVIYQWFTNFFSKYSLKTMLKMAFKKLYNWLLFKNYRVKYIASNNMSFSPLCLGNSIHIENVQKMTVKQQSNINQSPDSPETDILINRFPDKWPTCYTTTNCILQLKAAVNYHTVYRTMKDSIVKEKIWITVIQKLQTTVSLLLYNFFS